MFDDCLSQLLWFSIIVYTDWQFSDFRSGTFILSAVFFVDDVVRSQALTENIGWKNSISAITKFCLQVGLPLAAQDFLVVYFNTLLSVYWHCVASFLPSLCSLLRRIDCWLCRTVREDIVVAMQTLVKVQMTVSNYTSMAWRRRTEIASSRPLLSLLPSSLATGTPTLSWFWWALAQQKTIFWDAIAESHLEVDWTDVSLITICLSTYYHSPTPLHIQLPPLISMVSVCACSVRYVAAHLPLVTSLAPLCFEHIIRAAVRRSSIDLLVSVVRTVRVLSNHQWPLPS